MKKEIIFCNKTDIGKVREKNEDYYGYFSTPHGELFIVADGMGGYAGGEIASTMAVDIISEYVKKYKGDNLKEMLENAIQLANKKIYQKSLEDTRFRKMGTTVVVLLIHKNKAIVAHVGDSRCYLFRKNKLIWVTKDHTKVQYMLDRKMITPEEAKRHPDRHILLQALGSEKPVNIDFNEFTLSYKDRILLCTDGLYEYIKDESMEKLIRGDIEKVCDKLVDIANEMGGADNITVQIIEYVGMKPKVRMKRILILVPVIVIAFFAGLFIRDILTKLQKEPIPMHRPIISLSSNKQSYQEGDEVKLNLKITSFSDDAIQIMLQPPTKEGWKINGLKMALNISYPQSPLTFTKGETREIELIKQNITPEDRVIKIKIVSNKFGSIDTFYSLKVAPKPKEKPEEKPKPVEKFQFVGKPEAEKITSAKAKKETIITPTDTSHIKTTETILTEKKESIPILEADTINKIEVDTSNIKAIYDKRRKKVKITVPIKNKGKKEADVLVSATTLEDSGSSKKSISPGKEEKVEINLQGSSKPEIVNIQVKMEDKEIYKKEVPIK